MLVIKVGISTLVKLNVVAKVIQITMDTCLVTCDNLLLDHKRLMN